MTLECPSGQLNTLARGSKRKDILQMGIVFADKLEVSTCSETANNDPFNCS
jgi:hypothetical protein